MSRNGVTPLIEELSDLSSGDGEVSVGDVMDRIGHRGTGVFLLVPALLGMSPLAAIPTIPTLMALIVVIFAAQIALGREAMWLPDFLMNRSVSEEKLHASADKMKGVAGWLDRAFGRRLEALAGPTANRAAAILSILLAALVPPLELVPLAAALPLAAIAAFGLALVLRDGIVMLLAFAVSLGALWTAWSFFLG